MDIKMPDGTILSTDNVDVAESYIKYMNGKIVEPKKERKSATKVSSAKEAE